MKMKLFPLILSAALCGCLAACGDSDTSAPAASPSEQPAESETTAPESTASETAATSEASSASTVRVESGLPTDGVWLASATDYLTLNTEDGTFVLSSASYDPDTNTIVTDADFLAKGSFTKDESTGTISFTVDEQNGGMGDFTLENPAELEPGYSLCGGDMQRYLIQIGSEGENLSHYLLAIVAENCINQYDFTVEPPVCTMLIDGKGTPHELGFDASTSTLTEYRDGSPMLYYQVANVDGLVLLVSEIGGTIPEATPVETNLLPFRLLVPQP